MICYQNKAYVNGYFQEIVPSIMSLSVFTTVYFLGYLKERHHIFLILCPTYSIIPEWINHIHDKQYCLVENPWRHVCGYSFVLSWDKTWNNLFVFSRFYIKMLHLDFHIQKPHMLSLGCFVLVGANIFWNTNIMILALDANTSFNILCFYFG